MNEEAAAAGRLLWGQERVNILYEQLQTRPFSRSLPLVLKIETLHWPRPAPSQAAVLRTWGTAPVEGHDGERRAQQMEEEEEEEMVVVVVWIFAPISVSKSQRADAQGHRAGNYWMWKEEERTTLSLSGFMQRWWGNTLGIVRLCSTFLVWNWFEKEGRRGEGGGGATLASWGGRSFGSSVSSFRFDNIKTHEVVIVTASFNV